MTRRHQLSLFDEVHEAPPAGAYASSLAVPAGRYRLSLKREALDSSLLGYTFSRPSAAVRFFQQHLLDRPQEVVLVVYLDPRHRPILFSEVNVGTSDRSLVDVQGILATGLLARAHGFMMAHNHPSGRPEPSLNDLLLTRRLVQAADLVGLTLCDHLILGEAGQWVSLRQKGECELPS